MAVDTARRVAAPDYAANTFRPILMLKPAHLCAATALLFAACAGNNDTTRQSPGEPPRFATSQDVKTTDRTAGVHAPFARGRVYLVERLETAEAPRGAWRTLGETIRQNGSTIEFTELSTGKTITFTAPHQITPTKSKSDRATGLGNSEIPGQGRNDIPEGEVKLH